AAGRPGRAAIGKPVQRHEPRRGRAERLPTDYPFYAVATSPAVTAGRASGPGGRKVGGEQAARRGGVRRPGAAGGPGGRSTRRGARGAAAGPAGRAPAAPWQRGPFDQLVDEVFGEQPPEEARNALQTYIARLRHALGPAAAGVVVTRAPDYVLEVPGGAVDVERFCAQLVRAREAESPTAALALLEQALALWRGTPYGEFAATFARGEALRLQELWLAAREDRAALLVRLGRLAEATAALEAIVAEEPWRERAVELLVSTLC